MGVNENVTLMDEVSKVFSFISGLYDTFPTVIKLVMLGTFGAVILVGILRGVGR